METRYEFEMGRKSSLSKGNVDVRMSDEAELPLLSVTAPSEEVSEVEDNLGTSSLQSPTVENGTSVTARTEAEKIVDDVLTKASEILENRSTAGAMVVLGRTTEIIISNNEDKDNRDDDWNTDASHLSDEQETVIEVVVNEEKQKMISQDIRDAADEFVKNILAVALEEANKRITELKQAQWESSRDNLPELTEIVGNNKVVFYYLTFDLNVGRNIYRYYQKVVFIKMH
ncbi:hypothetical protein CHUAL_011053 [Chamberlinius hualienensis]